LQAALGATRALPVSDEKISFEYKVKRMFEGALMSPERAHVYWNGTFSDEQKDSLLKLSMPPALEDILAEARKAAHGEIGLAEFLWFDQRYYLADDILTKSDRMSMAHSVEVRPAFLDHRIVEFAVALPTHLKIKGSRQKVILKELMQSKLPPGFFDRPKVGLDIPSHEWIRGPLRDLLMDAVSFGLREYGHFFDADAIQSLVKRHMNREINAGYHLWGLLILFLWMKKWKIRINGFAAPRLQTMAAAGPPGS
jgi:asparagine synthase (glutamine-hydrolysing)